MKKLTTPLKCIFVCLMMSFSSCIDSESFFLGVAAYQIIDCNELYLLEPPLNRDVEYEVLVTDKNEIPLSGVKLNINVKKLTCIGETVQIYSKDVTTDAEGLVNDRFLMNYTWDKDSGEWIIAVLQPGITSSGYVLRFRQDENYLFKTISIANLDG